MCQILSGDKVAEGDVWVGGIAIFSCIPSIDLMKEQVVVNAQINSDSFLRTKISAASSPFFHPILSLNATILNSC